MTPLDALADELGVSGRTLRRAGARGLFRYERPSPKRVALDARERRYLRKHWPVLQALVAIFRTEPNVRLAVLFGSFARGEAHAESDLDVLVQLGRPEQLAAAWLSLRLSEQLDRKVQIVALEDAERSPLLLADALRDGRVLVDRDEAWPKLRQSEAAIQRRAQREGDALERAAWETLEWAGA
ncbi:MAG: type VII toxin-antitoxin system MntA family adenylyltransferase antitoxin [Gaiellaceae bacterium]